MLVSFFRANRDIFAWKPADIPRVRSLIEQSLIVDPKATLKRQHLCHFADDRRDVIKKELAKLLAAGFIREVFHPEWLANPVLVHKKNTTEWRMCVDYTDLNKHCPKDPFRFLRIDQIIDSTAGCDLLCFLNCYSGYHQIAIKEEDQEKTAFITPFGAYYYTTMSFGLKNADAAYQRAIQACFKRQHNKNVKAYVDDVVVKTRNSNTLIADIEETFASLREYRWKLNPNKCVFSVPSRKLLGFIIGHRGIEANPDKISAITKMKAPTRIKDVQKLTGCMAALNRVISKLGEWGLPFFKLLKHQEKFVWIPEADQALAQLKDFLSKPPILTAPRKKGAATALPRCDYSRGQYCHRPRAAGRWPRLPSPTTSLLRQRGPIGIQDMIPTSTEATVCSAHHLAEAMTLLPEVLDHHRHRLPARRHLTEPGCYWKNLQMGSRTWRPHH
jgi:hypothetical protein